VIFKKRIKNGTQHSAKNGELLRFVKDKVQLNLGRHPRLARGSKTTTSDRDLSKAGVISRGRILNLIGLLKYVQTRKINSKSRIVKAGFTLVELAIVLVIIGLLVGGVLVGNDLINAAAVRAQIQQIEKYNTAANTFKIKYGYLPGDIPDPTATAFGFAARGTKLGQGDGDGILQGFFGNNKYGWVQSGEPMVFWVDLSTAGLIDGNFSTATPTNYPTSDVTGSAIDNYYPHAKISSGIYVYTLNVSNSGGFFVNANPIYRNDNFFTISHVNKIANLAASSNNQIQGTTGISVKNAYNIDNKIDDGFPITGKVTTISSITNEMIFSNNDKDAVQTSVMPGSSAIVPSSTTCYDNNNNSANPVVYSLSQNGGNGLNCALSFKFQ
jgi:prepilin-type N-terminal cleavage/methylation domain-containing protein